MILIARSQLHMLWVLGWFIMLYCNFGSSTDSPSVSPTREPTTSRKPTMNPTTRMPTVSYKPTALPTFAPTFLLYSAPYSYKIKEYAGTGSAGLTGDDGPATSATLYSGANKFGIFLDTIDGAYYADGSSTVRKVDSGIMRRVIGTSTAANSGNGGAATSASVLNPMSVWVNSVGQIYVPSSTATGVVRTISPTTGIVSTFAGGGSATSVGFPATSTSIGNCYTVVGDSSGVIYVSSTVIRTISTLGIVETVFGTGTNGFGGENGPATSATMSTMYGLFVDSLGNLYTAESGFHVVRKISYSDQIIIRIAGIGSAGFNGDGLSATQTQLYNNFGVWVDTLDNVFIAERSNYRIRLISSANNVGYTVAGNGAGSPSDVTHSYSLSITEITATASAFQPICGVWGDVDGNLLVGESSVLRKLVPTTPNPTLIPTVVPTEVIPTVFPTLMPSCAPTEFPTINPTHFPTILPSLSPSNPPSIQPSECPSVEPTMIPSVAPSVMPTTRPSLVPSMNPSTEPSVCPSIEPTIEPSISPTDQPTASPSDEPTIQPSDDPSVSPTVKPSVIPSISPTVNPTIEPSVYPSVSPSVAPSTQPSIAPTNEPSISPSTIPSVQPSILPSDVPTIIPSIVPTTEPTVEPSVFPTVEPTIQPSACPTISPTVSPSKAPTASPTDCPTTLNPTISPSLSPSLQPTTLIPTLVPTVIPTLLPTFIPTYLVTMSQNSTLPSNDSISAIGSAKFKIVLPFAQVLQGSTTYSDIDVSVGSFGVNSIVFGGATKSSSVSINNDDTVKYLNAVSSDFGGRSVAVVEDSNGDGYAELIIGDPYAAKCYVLLGTSKGLLQLTAGFTIFGETESDLTGWSVSDAGDINNDKLHDFVIGAPNVARGKGAVYVIFGTSKLRDVHLSSIQPSQGFVIYGENNFDFLGLSCSNIGDFNKDGYDDIVVGAFLTISYNSGAAYIVFGNTTIKSLASIKQLSSRQGFKVVGTSFSLTGYSVSAAGDVNKDGFDDVLIGNSPQKISVVPSSYVLYGHNYSLVSTITLASITPSQGYQVVGGGVAVGPLGDIDGDGFDDVLIGSNFGFNGAGYIITWDISYSYRPSVLPTESPTKLPSKKPTLSPTTRIPSIKPTLKPTAPSMAPTVGASAPTSHPSASPSSITLPPTIDPSEIPTELPSLDPSMEPSEVPSLAPSQEPSICPSLTPTVVPSESPTTFSPTDKSRMPLSVPTLLPSIYLPPPIPSVNITLDSSNTTFTRLPVKMLITINTTADVNILGDNGIGAFLIHRNPNTKVIINYFNRSCDVIDFSFFSQYSSMDDLVITSGSVIFTLPDNQIVKLMNLMPVYMLPRHFKFSPKSSDDSSKNSMKYTMIFIISIVVVFAPLMFLFLFSNTVRDLMKYRKRVNDDSQFKTLLNVMKNGDSLQYNNDGTAILFAYYVESKDFNLYHLSDSESSQSSYSTYNAKEDSIDLSENSQAADWEYHYSSIAGDILSVDFCDDNDFQSYYNQQFSTEHYY